MHELNLIDSLFQQKKVCLSPSYHVPEVIEPYNWSNLSPHWHKWSFEVFF